MQMIDALRNSDIMHDPLAKAGCAGAMVGLLGGIIFDVEYLEHAGTAHDEHVAKVRQDLQNVTHLRKDLHLAPPKDKTEVMHFISSDIRRKKTKLEMLETHQPNTPNFVAETGVVAGSISLCGMAAVAIACVVRHNANKRRQRETVVKEKHEQATQATQIMDNEFERLELWLKHQGGN